MMSGLPKVPVALSCYGMGIDYSSAEGYCYNGAHAGYLANIYYFPDKTRFMWCMQMYGTLVMRSFFDRASEHNA
jgi:hypothetical protein